MIDNNLETTAEAKVAALGGFLEGISYLNRDRRNHFGEAFSVSATNVADLIAELKALFAHIPDLELSFDSAFVGGFRQLEQDIKSQILTDPYVVDESRTGELNSYLSFKVMDRLDEIADLKDCVSPQKLVGGYGGNELSMTFYWIATPSLSYVIYFSGGSLHPAQ